ncbi:MAG TPA: alcohol dehydrogenase catalytic domain-containing protein, partial [Chthoniobacterales bacterium]|nr:alcohol dehydrogenase catalytic domain-containing protein [Chthoniobacterales bacterium]
MNPQTIEVPTTASRAGAAKQDLPKTMRAVVAYAPGDYRLETVPVPRAGADDIIIKVEACGICAGDIKSYVGAESFWGGNGQPKYIKAPMIPGHEFVGHVVELGENVERQGKFKLGDRVI